VIYSYAENDQFPLPESEKLSFSHFDVDKVLSSSKLLLGSSGDEYQLPQNFAGEECVYALLNTNARLNLGSNHSWCTDGLELDILRNF